jgi:hypothetical protein
MWTGFINSLTPAALLRVESSSVLRQISPLIFIRPQALTHRGSGLAVPWRPPRWDPSRSQLAWPQPRPRF